MDISETLKLLGSFALMVKVHDRIWRDKDWPIRARLTACHEVWAIVIREHRAPSAEMAR